MTPPRTTQLAHVLILIGAVLGGGLAVGLLLVGLLGALQSAGEGFDDPGSDEGGGWVAVVLLLGVLAVAAASVWVAFRIRSGHVAGLVGGVVLSVLGLAQQVGEAAVSDRFRPGVVVWAVVDAVVLGCLVSPSNRSYVRAMTALRAAGAPQPAPATGGLPPGSPPAP